MNLISQLSSARPVQIPCSPWILASWLGLACLTVPFGVHAQEVSAENKAAARELAIEGIQLAQAGQCTEALPRLERAEQLYHAVTILTWIGECQIQLGFLVEGTENLNRVIREELEEAAPSAFFDAKKRAQTLLSETTPRIARLTLHLSPASLQDFEVTIGGKPLDRALIGAPRPTDPGTHELVARAAGYREVRKKVALAEGERLELTLELEPAPLSKETGDDPAQLSSGSGSSTWNTLGWVGVGVGGALLAGGAVTGVMALNAKSTLDCSPNQVCRTAEDISKLDEANAFALASTILFGAGGALLTTGIIFLLTGDSNTPSAEIAGAHVKPHLSLGQLGVSGSF